MQSILTKFLFVALLLVPMLDAKSRWQRFTATAYAVDGETASGKQTREGRTVAADHSVLPLGTRIEIKGAGPYSGIYVVQDGGPKVNGREVDIFIDDPAEAKRFGRKPVQVRVLQKPEPSTK